MNEEQVNALLAAHPEIHIDQAQEGGWNFRHDDNEQPSDSEYWNHGCYGTRWAAAIAALEEYGLYGDEL